MNSANEKAGVPTPAPTPMIRPPQVYHSLPVDARAKVAERVARRRADMPELYRKLFDRCISGAASPREAIKMHCLECWGYVRAETASCDNYACALWRLRPYHSALPARQGDLSGAESTTQARRIL